MREVFVTNYPEDAVSGESLARILTKPTEKDSDLLQAQAIDILAQSNLMLLVGCHHVTGGLWLICSRLQSSAFRSYPD